MDESVESRGDLEFWEAAALSFGFLVDAYGFHLAERRPMSLMYEREDVFVRVAFDADYSHELTVGIGLRLPGQEVQFGVQEVLALTGVGSDGEHADVYAYTAEAMFEGAIHLAQIVRRYAAPLLNGDRAFFLRLSDLATKRTKLDTDPARSEASARRDIEAAWERGDFYLVAMLYAWLDEHDLGEADWARRQYARSYWVRGPETDGSGPPPPP